jgi:hypothetical protein
MSNFIDSYVAVCHNFNLSDVSTRRNMEQFIVPRLRQLRLELTAALWRDRRSQWPVPRDARRQMLDEVRKYAASIRTATGRIRTYEALPSV